MTVAEALVLLNAAIEAIRVVSQIIAEAAQEGRDLTTDEIAAIDQMNAKVHDDFRAELERRRNEG
ncbi:hypothetical protein D4Q85_00245 [bacterium]|nr:MAG: hypothetical protein D4Q85_00245 [bacterium]